MKKPVIEARHLQTIFNNKVIHKDISFTIYEGEIYGLLGGSGSGKTTLLRHLILLTKPSNGYLKILGKDILSINGIDEYNLRTQYGVCFQSGALFTSLTVFQNLAFILKEYTKLTDNQIAKIVYSKLKMVGLNPNVSTLYPSELSGGMIKRVALARALIMEPKLLFLDEPTSGLDPISSEAFDNMILTIRNLLGLTIVIITHDIDTIFNTLDRMVILADGVVATEGTLEEVLMSNHTFIQSFFTSNRAINRLRYRRNHGTES